MKIIFTIALLLCLVSNGFYFTATLGYALGEYELNMFEGDLGSASNEELSRHFNEKREFMWGFWPLATGIGKTAHGLSILLLLLSFWLLVSKAEVHSGLRSRRTRVGTAFLYSGLVIGAFSIPVEAIAKYRMYMSSYSDFDSIGLKSYFFHTLLNRLSTTIFCFGLVVTTIGMLVIGFRRRPLKPSTSAMSMRPLIVSPDVSLLSDMHESSTPADSGK